jgi:hypothetical protein
MVLNSSLNMILPPNLKPTPELTPTPGDNGKQKNNKRKSDKAREERIIKNATPITDFLMKDDEVWKRNFSGQMYKGSSQVGQQHLHVRLLVHPWGMFLGLQQQG